MNPHNDELRARVRLEGFNTLSKMLTAPPDGILLQELADMREVSTQAIRKQMQRGEADGLVYRVLQRRPNDPKNCNRFALTQRGRAAVLAWAAGGNRLEAAFDSGPVVRKAIATQPNSVFDMGRLVAPEPPPRRITSVFDLGA